MRSYTRFVEALKDSMRADADNVIVVDGDEGSGKSNLGIHLARSIDPAFSPEDNCVWTIQDWNRIFDENKRQQVILVDEGGNLLFSRDYASSDSKFMVKLLMQARILQSTIIICLPNMHWLEKYVREHRVKYRIHMHGRTTATVQRKFTNWRTGETTFTDCLNLSRLPNLREAAPELWREYETRKIAAVRAFSGDHREKMRMNRLATDARIKKLEEELRA